jgi:sec-independent protein translocase protein TatA
MRSFLGVGAPEAILVAVVALVVFGPKGLADVRRVMDAVCRTRAGPAVTAVVSTMRFSVIPHRPVKRAGTACHRSTVVAV